jgi:hypothetical protein
MILDHERLDVYRLAPGHQAGKEMLVRVVSMLIKLAQSLEE